VLRIRLTRFGKKKQPFYRIVVADDRAPRDGKYIEKLGYYNPLTEPEEVKAKSERLTFWLNKGAQMTATVRSLLKKHKYLTGLKKQAETQQQEVQ